MNVLFFLAFATQMVNGNNGQRYRVNVLILINYKTFILFPSCFVCFRFFMFLIKLKRNLMFINNFSLFVKWNAILQTQLVQATGGRWIQSIFQYFNLVWTLFMSMNVLPSKVWNNCTSATETPAKTICLYFCTQFLIWKANFKF